MTSLKFSKTTVYLDQNKWIDLARANYNRSDGKKFKIVLDVINKSIRNDQIILPISTWHIVETQNDPNASRRKRLAKVMATLSQGWALSSSDEIKDIEAQISAANIFNFNPPDLPRIFGKGIHFAWDIEIDEILHKTFPNISNAQDKIRKYKEFLSTPLGVETILLQPSEVSLRNAREKYISILDSFQVESEHFRNQFESTNRSRNFHKVIFMVNVLEVLNSYLNNACACHGRTLDDIKTMGDEVVIKFLHGIPSLDVELELIPRRNVNWNKKVSRNDLADIAFLQTAIPYCDIVVTEKSWKHHIIQSGLDTKYKTIVLDDLCDLEQHIDEKALT